MGVSLQPASTAARDGLGSFPDVSLKQARLDAAEARALISCSTDPIEHSDLQRLGNGPISTITQIDICDTLAPIWQEKADTAHKALNRLWMCFRHAGALGLDVDLHAPDKAKAQLGAQGHVPRHSPGMPWQDVPEFYTSLEEPLTSRLALRLMILTGLRSHPIRCLHQVEIDGNVQPIARDKMKDLRGKSPDFRVPLTPEALRVIDRARPMARDGLLFPGRRKGVISDMTLSQLMNRRGLEAHPHGFRAGLWVWLAECTDAPHEVAESGLSTDLQHSAVAARFARIRRDSKNDSRSSVISFFFAVYASSIDSATVAGFSRCLITPAETKNATAISSSDLPFSRIA